MICYRQHFYMQHQVEIWSKVFCLLTKSSVSPHFYKKIAEVEVGRGHSHFKWCANDILKITLILKIMLLLPSMNKNFSFPSLSNLLLLTFWHSSFYWLFCISSLIAYFWEVFPSPYQTGRDKGMKLWVNNWIPKAMIKASKFCERKPIKYWHYRLKQVQWWNKFLLCQRY